MKILKLSSKRSALPNPTAIKMAFNSSDRPFKQMPSKNTDGQNNADRINEHDLFSLYTADIIKEETVFIR
jgi:hypothetical protein